MADACRTLRARGVEATDLGRFVATGRLTLRYHGETVADLSMDFLHDGRPPVVRRTTFTPPAPRPDRAARPRRLHLRDLLAILGTLECCSKEWIVRQYDHEVQARTVVKPLVGVRDDGPGDASVVLPVRGSTRGLAVAAGSTPATAGSTPTRWPRCVIDEAIRNCVAVGADPDRIALLDNFCWGNTERPETLGSLVRAAQGCHDLALAYGRRSSRARTASTTSTRSGREPAIPPTLLISAIGNVPDIQPRVTMDLKRAGNLLFLVGSPVELGGSLALGHLARPGGGPRPPGRSRTRPTPVPRGPCRAIQKGLIRACHDPSEGGLAVALAEMAFAGGHGLEIDVRDVPVTEPGLADSTRLFAESPTRFLVEVTPADAPALETLLGRTPHARIGRVLDSPQLQVLGESGVAIDANIDTLRSRWQKPFAEATE